MISKAKNQPHKWREQKLSVAVFPTVLSQKSVGGFSAKRVKTLVFECLPVGKNNKACISVLVWGKCCRNRNFII